MKGRTHAHLYGQAEPTAPEAVKSTTGTSAYQMRPMVTAEDCAAVYQLVEERNQWRMPS